MMLLLPSREAGHKCQIAHMKQDVYLSICCSKLLCGLQSSSFPVCSLPTLLLHLGKIVALLFCHLLVGSLQLFLHMAPKCVFVAKAVPPF